MSLQTYLVCCKHIQNNEHRYLKKKAILLNFKTEKETKITFY